MNNNKKNINIEEEAIQPKSSKSDLNKKALVAGSFFVLCSLLVRAVSFLTTPVYTRLVSTTQYGEIKVYESWLLIMVPILSLCLYRSVERAKYDFRDKFDEFVSAVQTLAYLITASVFLIVTLFFRDSFMTFTEMDWLMYVFMILYTFGYTGILFFQRREKQQLRYKKNTIVSASTMIPAVILSIILLYIGNITGNQDNLVNLRIIGFYTPQIIGGFVVIYIIWRDGKAFINKQYWKYALKYSVPLIPEMISIQIMNQSDKIMIQKLIGNENVGLFSLATTVSYIIWILEDSVWNAWLPWLYEKISRGEEKDIEKPWMTIVTIFSFISWCLVMLAPELILLFGGPKYTMSMYLVAPMVTGTLFRFFSYCYSTMQNYHKKTQYVALGTVLTMFINVGLNYVAILNFGYQAAAYTTCFSYMMLIVIQGYLEKKVTGYRIVSIRKMMMISVGLIMINILSMYSFTWVWYARYAIILFAGIILLIFMYPLLKQLLTMLKGKKK